MALLGFKRQFAPYVQEGSKTHTIRAKRKLRPKVGETLHCYVDPRQGTMRLLGRFKCIRVQEIEIDFREHADKCPLVVVLDGVELTPGEETQEFFRRDGFRDPGEPPAVQAFSFWKKRGFPWFGDLIHWEFRP